MTDRKVKPLDSQDDAAREISGAANEEARLMDSLDSHRTSDRSSPATSSTASTDRERTFSLLTACCGLIVAAIGACVLIGWRTDQMELVRLGFEGAVMRFNTALLVVAAGAAVVVMARQRFILMHVLGAAIVASAAATALQYPLGLSFGIDDLFFKNQHTDVPLAGARMSINSAFCFILLGCAFIAVRPPGGQRWRFFAILLLSSIALTGATVALISHATGLAASLGWGGTYGMAVPTAASVALCAGSLLGRGFRQRAQYDTSSSTWFPLLLGNVAAVGTLILWMAFSFQDEQRIRDLVIARFVDVQVDLRYALRHYEGVVVRMAKRWNAAGGTPEVVWRDDVQNYLDSLKGFQGMAWVDAGLDARWIQAGAQDQIARTVATDAALRETIQAARRQGMALALVRRTESLQQANVWLCQPVVRKGADDGCLLAIVDLHRLLSDLLQRTPMEGQMLAIRDGNRVLFESALERRPGEAGLTQTAELHFTNRTWTLTDIPSHQWADSRRSALPEVALGAGLLLSLLSTAVLRLATATRESYRNALMSEARFRAIFDYAPLGIVMVGDQGRFGQSNARFQNMLEVTDEQLQQLAFSDLTHPDDLAIAFTAYNEVLSGKNASNHFELRSRKPNGETIWLSISCSALPTSGTACDVLAMVTEITYQKLAERRLAVQYRLTKLLSENATETDVVRQVIRSVCEQLEWDFGTFWSLSPEESQALRPSAIWQVPDLGDSDWAFQTRQAQFTFGQGLPGRVWASKETTWIEDRLAELDIRRAQAARTSGLRSALAFPICSQTTFHGVMEFVCRTNRPPDQNILDMVASLGAQLDQGFQRKAAEKTLHETMNLQQAIFDSADRSIIATSTDGVIQAFNAAAERMTGYSAAEVIGKQTPELFHDREELAAKAKELSVELGRTVEPGFEACRAKLLSERIEEREWTYIRKDGMHFPVLVSATAIRNPQGEITGYLGIANDITQQRRARQELLVAKQAAELANSAKSEFLANMSHEIRTPMNGILGMIDLTLRSDLTQRQREFLNLAKSSAETLLRLLNDILDFSKIEAGRLELESIDFSLRECLGQTLQTLALPAQRKGLELSCAISPDVPDSLIGDSGRLTQIVVNVVGNATKFTERGEVAVRVERDELADESVLLHVTIRDTGIGIAPEKREHIFAAFSQADSSMTRRYGGTGLGLTICSHLVKSMGGRIWVESELGLGSVFHFTARFGLGKQSSQPAGGPAYCENWAGMRVLVVDDNSTNRLLLQELLIHWGLKPTLVDDGPTALASLRESHEAGEPYRLVLLDAQMPGMDGFTVAERIRDDAGLSGTAVMMLSSIDRPGDFERYKELGIRVYLQKPVRESDLLESIVAVVDPSTARRAERNVPTLPPPVCLLRVLLAEDTPANQRLVLALLEDRGHRVVVANDGQEALEILERESFDLILMDVQMPRMDGFQATAAIRLREESTGRHIPIIAMTAHAMKGDRENCLAAGMDGYISKPIQAEQFILLVEGGSFAADPSPDPSQDAPPKTGGVVFDEQEALSRARGQRALLRQMAELFLADCPGLVDQIRAAQSRGDCQTLEQSAHRLKGAAANLSAHRVVEVARRLEEFGREGHCADAEVACAELEAELTLLERALGTLTSEGALCES